MSPASRRASASCIGAAVLFGASTPAAKVVLGAVGPVTTAGLLYLGAAVAVVPAAWGGRRQRPRLSRSAWLRLMVAVGLGGCVAPILAMLALARAPASNVALWFSLETIFTASLAVLFFGEHLGLRGWLANAAVVLGGGLLVLRGAATPVLPALLVACACVAWALDNNLIAALTEVRPVDYTFAKGSLAGLANLALGLFIEHAVAPVRWLLGGLVIGGLGFGVSLVLYVRGARALGASRAQMLFATAPFVGAALSWTLLEEPFTPLQLIAACVMAAGVVLLLRERHEHVHTHDAHHHTHEHRHDDGHHQHSHPELPAGTVHTHSHDHRAVTHSHPHADDAEHRHRH